MGQYNKEAVKRILMERDGDSEQDAQERIDIFEEELGDILDDTSCLGIFDAENLVMTHFGLEPDYLLAFLYEGIEGAERGDL